MTWRIPIHVTECHGMPRRNEAIRIGVPVARGWLAESAAAVLVNARGSRVPAQFRTLATWPDRSVKWLLVDALVEVDAQARLELALSSAAGAATAASTELRVSELGEHLEVDTGAAVFAVARRGGSPIAAVTIDGESLLDARGCRLRVLGPDAQPWQTSLEQAEIEEAGPVLVTIVSEGTARGPAKGQCLRLKLRCIFTLHSATARIECEIWNPHAAHHVGGRWDLGDAASILFKDVSFELRPARPVRSVQWQAEPCQELQQTTEPWLLYQDSSGGSQWRSPNHVDRKGSSTVSFRGYRVQGADGQVLAQAERATPFLTASSEAGWIAASVEKFWQHFPKALRWSGESVSVGLFPAESMQTFELQGGEKKRHTVFLEFGVAGHSSIAQRQRPLQVGLDPAHVAASAAVSCLTPQADDPNQAYLDYVASMLTGPSSCVAKREAIDEYGWRNFGDLYADHEAVRHQGPEPFISHYNNQYDFIYGAGLHFLRSGDQRWRELMEEAARHTIDIDIYHTTEDKAAFSGGLFWHTDHYKPAATCTHRTYSKANAGGGSYGGGPSCEHNYTSGLMQYYYLSGDPEARAAVLSLADWVVRMDDGALTLFGLFDTAPTGLASATVEPSYQKPGRGAGNSINALLDAYALSSQRRYLHKAEELLQRCIHPEDDIAALGLLEPEHRWSYLVFLQAVGKYLEKKRELAELDYDFHYARDSLMHYAEWMCEHEVPYKDVLDKVLLPTETWPAQDIRKCLVLHIAARYAPVEQRAKLRSRAAFFFERCLTDLQSFPTAYLTRPQVLLCVYGHQHSYFMSDPLAVPAPSSHNHVFGMPQSFQPQRQRVPAAALLRLRITLRELGRLLRGTWQSVRARW